MIASLAAAAPTSKALERRVGLAAAAIIAVAAAAAAAAVAVAAAAAAAAAAAVALAAALAAAALSREPHLEVGQPLARQPVDGGDAAAWPAQRGGGCGEA